MNHGTKTRSIRFPSKEKIISETETTRKWKNENLRFLRRFHLPRLIRRLSSLYLDRLSVNSILRKTISGMLPLRSFTLLKDTSHAFATTKDTRAATLANIVRKLFESRAEQTNNQKVGNGQWAAILLLAKDDMTSHILLQHAATHNSHLLVKLKRSIHTYWRKGSAFRDATFG